MTAPDPRALARQLGPDQMEALARAAFAGVEFANGRSIEEDFIAALTRLASPVEPEPRWPTETFVARFSLTTGRYTHIGDAEPRCGDFLTARARVVPADAVVLTAELADEALKYLRASPFLFSADLIRALRREPTP